MRKPDIRENICLYRGLYPLKRFFFCIVCEYNDESLVRLVSISEYILFTPKYQKIYTRSRFSYNTNYSRLCCMYCIILVTLKERNISVNSYQQTVSEKYFFNRKMFSCRKETGADFLLSRGFSCAA